MSVPSTYEHCSKAYLKIKQTATGYRVGPANISEFERAAGVGERLEPELSPMPEDVALTSLAISMARLADEAETIRHIAFSAFVMYKRQNQSWFKKAKDKFDVLYHQRGAGE